MEHKTHVIIMLLIAVLASSTLVSVRAGTIITPSIPEFSIKVVAHPYDLPPTTTSITTVDQYTGKETTITDTTPGYHVENKSIEVTIKNQPFTSFNLPRHEVCWYSFDHLESYISNESIAVNNYFIVQVRGHFGDEDDWRTTESGCNIQSDSENTIINVKLDKYPSDAVLDFQVSAFTGYIIKYNIKLDLIFGTQKYGQQSDWSNIHMLNLTDNIETVLPNTSKPVNYPPTPITPITTPTPPIQNTPAPTSTPTITVEPTQTTASTQQIQQIGTFLELNWETTTIALVTITIIILVASVLVLSKRRTGHELVKSS